MADNVVANPGVGGSTFAADDIGGVLHPRTKVSVGADGAAVDLAFGQAAMASSLPVVLASNQSSVPVTEASGAAIAASAAVMDDWDEADRAKVNPIAGQAGVQGGAGNSTALTQRVVIATDQATVPTTPAGNVAHDAADSGSPVKVGFKAETSPKGITLVADGDRTDALADADGLQMVKLNTSNADVISEAVSNTDGASTAFTNFSAVASVRNYVTAISVFRTDAGATPQYVDFRDGTAGAVLWRMPLPPNGGSVITSAVPLFKTTANTALAFDVSSALTTVYISVSGFQSKA